MYYFFYIIISENVFFVCKLVDFMKTMDLKHLNESLCLILRKDKTNSADTSRWHIDGNIYSCSKTI